MGDFIEFMFGVAVFVIVAFLGFMAIIVPFDYLDCRGFGNGTGAEVKWEWGCYAKTEDGKWVPKKYIYADPKEFRIEDKRK